MPTFPPESEDSEFDPETDWKELLEWNQPGGGDAFTQESASAVLVGLIPAKKRRDARNKILGWSWADEGAPYKLHRVEPWRHPEYSELVAQKVTFQQWGPAAEGKPPPVPPPPPPPSVYHAHRDAFTLGAFYPTRQGAYHYARATIEFGQVTYTMWGDDEIWFTSELGGKEYYRYCTIWTSTRPTLEVLQAEVDRGYLKFVEGPGGPTGPNGKDFPGSIYEYVRKCAFVMTWWSVPETFTHKGYLPEKILRAVGHVNGAPFLGFPKGTLLLAEPEFTRVQQCKVTADFVGLYANHINLPFQWADPPKGVTVSDYRGHQLMPWVHHSGESSTSGGPGWFGVERRNNQKFLPEADFEAIFTHVLS